MSGALHGHFEMDGKSRKPEGLFKQVHQTIDLLRSNPKHPGLQTHEYTSIENPYDKKQKVFEAYAQNRTPGAYRVFWCYGQGRKKSPSSRLRRVRELAPRRTDTEDGRHPPLALRAKHFCPRSRRRLLHHRPRAARLEQ
jgi:hypothetical protein